MRRQLTDREIIAIAMGAPIEMWLSFAALLCIAVISFFERPLARGYLLGGTDLSMTSLFAAIGVGLAMVGDFRGLIIAIVAFTLRALWYHFYAFHPLGKLMVAPHNIDPDWLWSACILPALLLMPCASLRAVRHMRQYWPLRPTRRRD